MTIYIDLDGLLLSEASRLDIDFMNAVIDSIEELISSCLRLQQLTEIICKLNIPTKLIQCLRKPKDSLFVSLYTVQSISNIWFFLTKEPDLLFPNKQVIFEG